MTAGGDQLNGGVEAVCEFTRAAIAEGAALKQHQAFAGGEGRCSCFFQCLNGLARFSAVEAAEVEAAPAGIHAALDQVIESPIARGRVISPDQMDRHGLMMAGMTQDHPIFTESIRRIRELLGDTGLQALEQDVLERKVSDAVGLELLAMDTIAKPAVVNAALAAAGENELKEAQRVSDLVRRPRLGLRDLMSTVLEEVPDVDDDAWMSAEIELKYVGYLERERDAAARLGEMDAFKLPTDLKYLALNSISTEGRQKLDVVRPASLAQAGRIPGISPSDLQNLIMEVLKLRNKVS